MDYVYEFLKELNIKKNENLVVAVSYGPDSMALLNILDKFYNENKIICAHVNHNHREESKKEEQDLKKYCNDNKIIFEVMKIKSYLNNKFTENEAREKRYEYFEQLLKKYNSKYLFTAHHGDDLIETILMRIVRGSSLKGYSGIYKKSTRRNYDLIRPLLYLTKKDILEYCSLNNIPFAIDKTNFDNSLTRNRYRNNILPLLKNEQSNVHLKFLKFSENLEETEKYMNAVIKKTYDKVYYDGKINIGLLKDEENIILKRVIMKYLDYIYKKDISLITNRHLQSIINVIRSSKPNLKISLPKNKVLVKAYEYIYFLKEESKKEYNFELKDKTYLPNGYAIEKVKLLDDTSNNITTLLSSEISTPLYVRNKKPKDKIEVLGLNGTKKVKDVLINEKVDKKKRDDYPVLVDSNNKVIWIPGLKKSKYDKSKKGNYDIILKYYKEEINDGTK